MHHPLNKGTASDLPRLKLSQPLATNIYRSSVIDIAGLWPLVLQFFFFTNTPIFSSIQPYTLHVSPELPKFLCKTFSALYVFPLDAFFVLNVDDAHSFGPFINQNSTLIGFPHKTVYLLKR